MSLALVSLLIVISMVALLLKRRRIGAILGVFSFLLVFWIGGGHLPDLLMDDLQGLEPPSQPVWRERNGIVVLGGGVVKEPGSNGASSSVFGRSRVLGAARLHASCRRTAKTCRVLASGGDPSRIGVPEAELMRDELKALGVPDSDILVEKESYNTFQNAQFSSPMLKQGNYDQIVLVTSGFHSRRSLAYFSRFLDRPPLAIPSDRVEAALVWLPISYNFFLMDLALHEYGGLLRFRLYNWLGLNPGSANAGAL